ncbi:MAG: phosphoribosylamine--glycine ligase [Cytophagaceae bacterium]|jgi:phosphoribosylamine--glycine ligase|nr:phosphoribosylamine--glycine ligase [Cytophagaceae bacterium]
MNILLVGSGGREHAIAWKLKQSKKCQQLFIAPGNAGTATVGINKNIAVTDFENLGNLCIQEKIDLVLVGPEVPLVEGIRDYFEASEALRSIKLIGPGKLGAQLEGSKDFSKNFMNRHGIPTAAARTFTSANLQEGLDYLDQHSEPIVLKADGLAAGKGVIISPTRAEAKEVLRDMIEQKRFGDASASVLVEQFLEGIELSVFALTDGKNYVLLPEAKDYKRIGEGDTGPNTGGMGAVSPVPFADASFMKKVEERIIQPTIQGLHQEGIPYVGFIFFGLIKVGNDPWVIEYNARMGDPETEVVMPRIASDLVELLDAAATGNLGSIQVEFLPEAATTVMLVAGGYPDEYEKGNPIHGLEEVKDALVFHAGTKTTASGEIVSNGGRVITVTAFGKDIVEALEKSKKGAAQIQWKDRYYRSDIGLDLVKLLH